MQDIKGSKFDILKLLEVSVIGGFSTLSSASLSKKYLKNATLTSSLSTYFPNSLKYSLFPLYLFEISNAHILLSSFSILIASSLLSIITFKWFCITLSISYFCLL